MRATRRRGQEYLLERRFFRRLSTGEIADPSFTQCSFPTGYHYDALRGLDYLRVAEVEPDQRAAEAIDLLRQKRGEDGRWPPENPHPDQLDIGMDEADDRPSRWNTLRALRILRWTDPTSEPIIR